MISPSGNFKLYLASKPVDFRKGMDGLAAIVMNEFNLDPFCGAIFIFRSKRADRLKLIVWDGTGLVMTYKRIEGAGFVWPRKTDGVISINRSQFEALFEGLDWQRVVPQGQLCAGSGLCKLQISDGSEVRPTQTCRCRCHFVAAVAAYTTAIRCDRKTSSHSNNESADRFANANFRLLQKLNVP